MDESMHGWSEGAGRLRRGGRRSGGCALAPGTPEDKCSPSLLTSLRFHIAAARGRLRGRARRHASRTTPPWIPAPRTLIRNRRSEGQRGPHSSVRPALPDLCADWHSAVLRRLPSLLKRNPPSTLGSGGLGVNRPSVRGPCQQTPSVESPQALLGCRGRPPACRTPRSAPQRCLRPPERSAPDLSGDSVSSRPLAKTHSTSMDRPLGSPPATAC